MNLDFGILFYKIVYFHSLKNEAIVVQNADDTLIPASRYPSKNLISMSLISIPLIDGMTTPFWRSSFAWATYPSTLVYTYDKNSSAVNPRVVWNPAPIVPKDAVEISPKMAPLLELITAKTLISSSSTWTAYWPSTVISTKRDPYTLCPVGVNFDTDGAFTNFPAISTAFPDPYTLITYGRINPSSSLVTV